MGVPKSVRPEAGEGYIPSSAEEKGGVVVWDFKGEEGNSREMEGKCLLGHF